MRIKKLSVYTSNIKDQLKFYRDELNFNILNYNETSFEIAIGYSILKFEFKENSRPYHIAFHIPDRQEEEALKWIENEKSALPYNNDKIIDFSNWQARSVYFYDPDKNIMELISRRDYSPAKSAIFSAENVVGIAEIGLVTKDVKTKFEQLHQECGLSKYDGDLERFCAIGEDSGLLITIDKNNKEWFPTGDKAYSADFILEFDHNDISYTLNFSGDYLEISTN